jgi:hypothetical protein
MRSKLLILSLSFAAASTVKEPRRKGTANHPGPKSSTARCEAASKALAEVHAGRVAECSALANADIGNAVGSPVRITLASLVQDAKPAPHCKVPGYAEPPVRFEVRLPSATWSRRFVQTGCGSGHRMEARPVSIAQLRDLRTRHDRRAARKGIQKACL